MKRGVKTENGITISQMPLPPKRAASAGNNSSHLQKTGLSSQTLKGRNSSSLKKKQQQQQQFSSSQGFMSNGSQLGSSQVSNRAVKQQLENSYEVKKSRLKTLTNLLRGEQETLQEEIGDSSEEEFEYMQKESAMKEFAKHVKRMEGTVAAGQSEQQNNSKLSQTATIKIEATGSLVSPLATTLVAKNPPPNRGVDSKRSSLAAADTPVALNNNFMDTNDLTNSSLMPQAMDTQVTPSEKILQLTQTSQVSLKEDVGRVTAPDPTKRRIHTLRERIRCIILIQSAVRMFVKKSSFAREKDKVNLLLREHATNNEVKKYESEIEQELFELGRGGFTMNVKQRYKINFPGVNIAGSENIQTNVFYPALLKGLADIGHLELLNDPMKVVAAEEKRKSFIIRSGAANLHEDEDLMDEEQLTAQTYNLFKARMNPLRKRKSAYPPAKIPIRGSNSIFTEEVSVIDLFVKRNKDNIPLSLKKSINDHGFIRGRLPEQFVKANNINTFKLRKAETIMIDEKDSGRYDNESFERESIGEIKKKPTAAAAAAAAAGSGKDESAAGSSVDYNQDSFEIDESILKDESSIKESILSISNKFNSSSVQEQVIKGKMGGVNVHDQSIGESIQEYSFPEEEISMKRVKKSNGGGAIVEEIIQTSIEEDEYGDEKFESISEDLNNMSNSIRRNSAHKESISEDIVGDSFESKGKKFKKQVTFEGHKKAHTTATSQSNLNNVVQQLTGSSSSTGILRRSVDQQSLSLQLQVDKYSTPTSAAPNSSPRVDIRTAAPSASPSNFQKETTSESWRRYQNLTIQFDRENQLKELTKEQLEMGRIQREVYSMLEGTKKLTEKWREEREAMLEKQSNVSLSADYLYSKFQCEFNRLIGSNSLSGKFALVHNFFEYRERQINQKAAAASPSQPSNQLYSIQTISPLESMMKQIDQKQEIMSGVLMQLVENLTSMRRTTMDFNEMRDNRKENDSKLDRLLANQEKILQAQHQAVLANKDEQIKALIAALAAKHSSISQISEEDLRKLKLKALLQQNAQPQHLVNQPRKQPIIQSTNILENLSMGSIISDQSSQDRSAGQLQESGVSWQSELSVWGNLTEREKAQVNEFDTDQVVDFLSALLLEELQGELFPVRMATSHMNSKKPSDKSMQERSIERIKEKKTSSNGGLSTSQHFMESPRSNNYKQNVSRGNKSERTLTEDSKYDFDFEDSEEKFHQSLQSNNQNKSYQFEDSESNTAIGVNVSANNGRKDVSSRNQTIERKNESHLEEEEEGEEENDSYKDPIATSRSVESNFTKEEEVEESVSEEEEYPDDFAESLGDSYKEKEKEKQKPKEEPKLGSLSGIQLKGQKQQKEEEMFDPLGFGGGSSRAFDRNSLLEEIEANEKDGTSLPSKKLPRTNAEEEVRGDNDFFEVKAEFDNGQERKDLGKDLYHNEEYYEHTKRALKGLVEIAKKQKKKSNVVKQLLKNLTKVDESFGQRGYEDSLWNQKNSISVFEPSEVKEDQRSVAKAFEERLQGNLVGMCLEVEAHYSSGKRLNKKKLETEINLRWERLCDTAAEQTLRIVNKVIPIEYYGDVKINKTTPFAKVKRFSKINRVPKDDGNDFELLEYELHREERKVEVDIADSLLKTAIRKLATDLLAIQKKQASM